MRVMSGWLAIAAASRWCDAGSRSGLSALMTSEAPEPGANACVKALTTASGFLRSNTLR